MNFIKRKKEKGKNHKGKIAALATLIFSFFFFPFSFCIAGPAPQFQVYTVDGRTFSGSLSRLAADGTAHLGNGLSVSGAEIVRIQRHGSSLPAFPEGASLVLTNGNRIRLDVKNDFRLEEGRLHFHLSPPCREAANKEIRLPRSFARVLWLAAPQRVDDTETLMHRLVHGRQARDLLILRNGDRLEGSLQSLDWKKGCIMEAEQRTVTVELARVACITFSSELQAMLRPALPFYHVILADGSRLDFATLELEADARHFKGKTVFAARLEIPMEHVVAIDYRRANIVYLSDLEPKFYEHTPFLDLTWPLVKDAAVTGKPLQLAGSTYDKGLGLHAQSKVRYALDGKFRWFEALVGLAEPGPGRCRIRVLLDGKAQDIGNQQLTFRDPPVRIRLNAQTAKELTLETLFGSFGDVKARVNWADARLLR